MAKLRVTVDGKDIMRQASVVAFDMQAGKVDAIPSVPLLGRAIDCTQMQPEYHGNGPTRLNTQAGLSYRESADYGVYTEGWKQASWFAYRLNKLTVGQRYRLEVDYPDDQVRTFTVSLIDQSRYGHTDGLIPYALDTGVACGAEFQNSHTMQTLSMDFNARQEDARLMFLNWHGPMCAAVSRIRLYRISEALAELSLNNPHQRHQAMFYEEHDRWYAYFTSLDDSQKQMLVAADRYARWCRAAGFDTIWDTVAIYGSTCWPSRLLDNAANRGFLRENNYPTGIIRPMLLTADRYGLRYIAELHPTQSIVSLPNETDQPQLYTSDSRGKKLLNPLHPTVQQWGQALVRELAEHDAFSKAFEGIAIRWMSWANSGWASFNAPDAGMDDWTLSAFCKDQGLDFAHLSKMDFGQRWNWINQNQKDVFANWKSERLIAYYSSLLRTMRAVRPDLKLYIHLFGDGADFGITDFDKLAAIRGIELTRSSQGYPPVRRLVDPSLLAASGVTVPTSIENAGKNSFFSNVYMECDFPLDALDLGSKPGQHMRICGAINPPGRQMLKRYAQLFADGPLPDLLGDGGLGYVQGEMSLRQELASAYLPLPRIKYEKMPNDDPVVLWQGSRDGRWYMYMINISDALVKVSLKTSARSIRQLADDQRIAVDGSITLPAYAMRSCQMDDRVSGMSVEVPSSVLDRLAEQLASARQLDDAQIALNQGKIALFAKLIRMGMDRGASGKDTTLTGLARLYAARGQFPINLFNIDRSAEQKSAQTDQVAQDLPVQLVRRIGDLRDVLTGTLDRMTDDHHREYLLLSDGRIVIKDVNGRYHKTLYTDRPRERCQSMRIVNGWIMFSSKPSPRKITQSTDVMQPFADSAMHKLPDDGVGFLFANDRESSRNVGLYRITPQLSSPVLLCQLPVDQRASDFLVTGKNALFTGRFGKPGSTRLCRHEIFNHSTRQRIWAATKKDVSRLAYRVATPRQRLSFLNAFSTK